jgi:8-oxo-dGTP pyrophosphatase MutT (NUDIX family)
MDPRLHFVTATAIVAKKDTDGAVRFLIAKRAPTEKAFPNKWTVPGGKLVRSEYEHLPKRPYIPRAKESEAPQWYNMMEWVVRKEVMEEVNVDVKNIEYLTDLVFIRPDGYPVVTLSFWCDYVTGDAKPGKDLTEVAWVTAAEAKKYDLIDGIAEEIAEVGKIIQFRNEGLLRI